MTLCRFQDELELSKKQLNQIATEFKLAAPLLAQERDKHNNILTRLQV